MRTIIILVIILILAGLLFVGKTFIENYAQSTLQKSVGPGFSIQKINIKASYISGFNATYVVPQSNLKLFHIGEIRMYPVYSSLFKKTIIINKIEVTKPDLYIYVTPQDKIIGPGMPKKGKENVEKTPPKRSIVINRIQINTGSLNYSDNAIQNPPLQINISNISSVINNLQIPPESSKSSIDLKGVLSGGGDVSLGGWANIKSQSTDVNFKINDADIKTFDPYITSAAPVLVNSGKAYLTSQIVIQNSVLSLPGTLEIMNLQTRADPRRQSEIVNSRKDSLLNQDRDKIKCEFLVKGDLNNPDFNFSKALIHALTQSIGDTLGGHMKQGAITRGKKSLRENLQRKK